MEMRAKLAAAQSLDGASRREERGGGEHPGPPAGAALCQESQPLLEEGQGRELCAKTDQAEGVTGARGCPRWPES